MARTITVHDDEGDTTTEIEVVRHKNGHVVRRIVIETESDFGLPDDMVSALIPYVGLPAARQPRAARPAPVAYNADVTPDPGEPADQVKLAPVVAFSAATSNGDNGNATIPVSENGLSNGQARVTAMVAPPGQIPAQRTATILPGDKRGGRPYRRSPTDDVLEKAIRQVGAKPKDLAEFFNVPRPTVNNWLYQWRKRTNAAVK